MKVLSGGGVGVRTLLGVAVDPLDADAVSIDSRAPDGDVDHPVVAGGVPHEAGSHAKNTPHVRRVRRFIRCLLASRMAAHAETFEVSSSSRHLVDKKTSKVFAGTRIALRQP